MFSTIFGHERIKSSIETLFSSGVCKNILLVGPSGVGKTLMAQSMIHSVWSTKEERQLYSMVIRGSQERGLQGIRGKIKDFSTLCTVPNKHKIILIDEIDCLTDIAQQALRRIMEKNDKITRFVMICNNSEHVIEAIQSRCLMFRLPAFSTKQTNAFLQDYCTTNEVLHDTGGLKKVAQYAGGDLRKALHLVKLHTMAGLPCTQAETIVALAQDTIQATVHGWVRAMIDYDVVHVFKTIRSWKKKGYSFIDLLETLRAYLYTDTSCVAENIMFRWTRCIAMGYHMHYTHETFQWNMEEFACHLILIAHKSTYEGPLHMMRSK